MRSSKIITAFFVGLAITGVVYTPGLSGGFLLDDYSNLGVLKQWIDGSILWQQVIYFNPSGPLGRPISMATFLGNAAINGMSPWGYKLTNLIIHLISAGLIAGLLTGLLKHDPQMRRNTLLIAVAIAIWWALLPIHVSTVLYVVQRMAQLSAMFIFAGLWLFVIARNRIESNRPFGMWILWLGIPTVTILAALSKENGLLLPLMCLAIEIGYFGSRGTPRSVKAFFIAFLVIPTVVGSGWIFANLDSLSAAYSNRAFGPYERVLSETRILWEYVFQILIPFGPRLGIFHDSYPFSTGLLSPIATIVAIIAWLGGLCLAWWLRKASPAILTGFLIFLFGHALESSIFPLELVFLHRNYGPSLGILLMTAGVFSLVAQKIRNGTSSFRRTMPAIAGIAALVLVSAVYARAAVWQSENALIAQELRHNPNSVRTRLVAATYAIQNGQPSAALYQVDAIDSFATPADRGTVSVFKLIIYYCEAKTIPEENVLGQFNTPPPYIHTYALRAFDVLTRQLEEGSCDALDPSQLLPGANNWLAQTRQPDSAVLVWRFRYDLARLLSISGDQSQALRVALKTWEDSGNAFAVGMFAFQLAARLNDLETAKRIFERLSRRADSPDLNKRIVLKAFKEYLKAPNNHNVESLPRAQITDDSIN